jgi:hypothetical protein
MGSRFVVKGVNDEQNFCSCCGKSGLKRVVWIQDTETGVVSHFGTTCAESPAKAFGISTEIRAAVRKFQSDAKKAAKAAERAAEHAAAMAKHLERADEFRAAYEEAKATYTGEMIIERCYGKEEPPRPAKQLHWLHHLMAVQRKHGLRN